MADLFSNIDHFVLSGNAARVKVVDFSNSGTFLKLGIKLVINDTEELYFTKDPDPTIKDLDAGKSGAIFNLTKYLVRKQYGHFTFPESDTPLVLHNIHDSVKVYAFRQSGIPSERITETSFIYFKAHQGKISRWREGKLLNEAKTFVDFLTETKQFLTWAPPIKDTDIYSPEKLYFLALQAGTYIARCRKTYKCGNTADIDLGVITATQYEVYELQCSYNQIITEDPYRVYKYEIWIDKVTGTTGNYVVEATVTETRTFVLRRKYESWARYFLFKNSLGVYEVIRTTGKVTSSADFKKTLTKITGAVDVETSLRLYDESQSNDDDNEIVYRVNSGNIDNPLTAAYFQELINSTDVYLLKGGEAYPINISDWKGTLWKDGQPYNSIELEIKHLLHDDFSSDFTAATPIPADFSNDFSIDFATVDGEVSDNDMESIAEAGADASATFLYINLAAETPEFGTGEWTLVTGPGNAVFVDTASPTTKVTVDAAGTYVFQWTVVFYRCVTSDTVTVHFTEPENDLYTFEYENGATNSKGDQIPDGWSLVNTENVITSVVDYNKLALKIKAETVSHYTFNVSHLLRTQPSDNQSLRISVKVSENTLVTNSCLLNIKVSDCAEDVLWSWNVATGIFTNEIVYSSGSNPYLSIALSLLSLTGNDIDKQIVIDWIKIEYL